MKVKKLIYGVGEYGDLIGILLIALYIIVKYPLIAGITIGESVIYFTQYNMLYWLAIGFIFMWFGYVYLFYQPSKICKKYGVAIIR